MSADGPAAGDRPRIKRMLPSVSDVVRELQAAAPHDPSLLFKVARQVCAEELGRVKMGKEAVALDVLVERARNILDPTRGESRRREDSGAFALDVPSGPVVAGSPAMQDNEDPFNDASAPLDLGWDNASKDSPLNDPGATEILTSYTSAPAAAVSRSKARAYEERSGPGDETISRLEHDAHEIDLEKAGARAQIPATVPSWGYDEDAATERVDPRSIVPANDVLFQAPAAKRYSMMPLLMLLGAVLAVLAAAYFVVGRPYLRKLESPMAVAAPRARRTRSRPGEAAVSPGATTSSPSIAASPAPIRTKPAMTVLEPVPEIGKKTAGKERPAVVVPSPAVSAKPAQPAVVAVRPSPTSAPPVTVVEASRDARLLAPASKSAGRAGALASPDWAGKPSTYVIHFTSYKDRKNAEKDAVRLGQEFGRAGHAVAVDLGSKGVWYRAVLGDFGSVDEAQAFRAELASKKTPSLGLVYHLISP